MTAAPESHRLLFEKDEVRVLEARIAPGETTGLHASLVGVELKGA